MNLSLAGLPRKLAHRVLSVSLQAFFLLSDRLFSVRKNWWCFATWDNYPHTLDNPRALFEEVKNDDSIKKILLQKRVGNVVHEGHNVTRVPSESFAGAYYLARSRVLITGYALRGVSSFSLRLRPERHHVIQVWHGIPLKRIGHLFPGETFWGEETPRYAATVCSSERDRQMMAAAFKPLPWDRVWLTGLPRNDLILKESNELPGDYARQLEELSRLRSGRRLVLYAPTWRTEADAMYTFSRAEKKRLQGILDKYNAVLGIRGHANIRHLSPHSSGTSSDHILSLNHIAETNLILRDTDVLITDYSSIYIDYLLLDRPIIHFVYDIDSYINERGFLYSPEEAFGGPSARTFDELIALLDLALDGTPAERTQQDSSYRLFHQHENPVAPEVCRRIQSLDPP